MIVPNANNPTWRKLITGELKPEIDFLATKILLNRLCMNFKKDSSEEELKSGINKLIDLFTTNLRVPKVQNDLIKIFGKETVQ